MTNKMFLCGFMASGKTTVGKALSKKLNIAFFDTDAEIEKSLNFNIMELFLNKQEGYFRKLETKILNSFKKTNLKNKSSFIVSTGGGMFTHNKNIKIAQKIGIIIFLDVSLRNCILRSSAKKRPILTTKTYEEIEIIYKNRRQKYLKFANIVVQNNKTIDLATSEIIKKLNFTSF